jgi:hypothetical protein
VYTATEAEATADAFSTTLITLVAGHGNVGNLQQQLAILAAVPRMEAELGKLEEVR